MTAQKPTTKKHAPRQGENLHDGVYVTPDWFLEEVDRIFPMGFDLAADKENSVVDRLAGKRLPNKWHFEERDDALRQSWAEMFKTDGEHEDDLYHGSFCWLNPPFNPMRPWAKKCAAEAQVGARIVLLCPNAPGADWYQEYVRPHALVLDLVGRLRFVGERYQYPKDLCLAIYGLGVGHSLSGPGGIGITGRGTWDLRKCWGYLHERTDMRENAREDRAAKEGRKHGVQLDLTHVPPVAEQVKLNAKINARKKLLGLT